MDEAAQGIATAALTLQSVLLQTLVNKGDLIPTTTEPPSSLRTVTAKTRQSSPNVGGQNELAKNSRRDFVSFGRRVVDCIGSKPR